MTYIKTLAFLILVHIGQIASQNQTLRLIPGPHEGRLEVFYNGAWGVVCYEKFNNQAASVVCRSLNQPEKNSFWLNGYEFEAGQLKPRISAVGCSGREATLFECSLTKFVTEVSFCRPDGSDIVGITCTDERIPVYFVYRDKWFRLNQIMDIIEYEELYCGAGASLATRGFGCTVTATGLNQPGTCQQRISLTRSNQGTLNCTVSNWQMPIAGELSVGINVLYKPTIECQSKYTVTEGSKVTITCSTDANPSPHQYRLIDSIGNIVVQGSEPSLVIDSVGPQHAGRYKVKAFNKMTDSSGSMTDGVGVTDTEIVVGNTGDVTTNGQQNSSSAVPTKPDQNVVLTYVLIGVGFVVLITIFIVAVVIKLRCIKGASKTTTVRNHDSRSEDGVRDISVPPLPTSRSSTVSEGYVIAVHRNDIPVPPLPTSRTVSEGYLIAVDLSAIPDDNYDTIQ